MKTIWTGAGVLAFVCAGVVLAGVFGPVATWGQNRGQAPAAATAPPPAMPPRPLPSSPVIIDTAEQGRVRVTIMKGLSNPWSLAFLPNGDMLITERPGRLRIVRNGVLDPQPITGTPTVYTDGLGGLMDIALHPRFAETRWVYLSYTKPAPGAAHPR